jgi:hypothetical protein
MYTDDGKANFSVLCAAAMRAPLIGCPAASSLTTQTCDTPRAIVSWIPPLEPVKANSPCKEEGEKKTQTHTKDKTSLFTLCIVEERNTTLLQFQERGAFRPSFSLGSSQLFTALLEAPGISLSWLGILSRAAFQRYRRPQ